MFHGDLSYQTVNCASYGGSFFSTVEIYFSGPGIAFYSMFWVKKFLRLQVPSQFLEFVYGVCTLKDFLEYL